MVFHTKAKIINNNNLSKIYDNVIIIKDYGPNDFLNKKQKELKGELIEYKPNFIKTSFDSQFPSIPNGSEI
jgi:hypothetical protein